MARRIRAADIEEVKARSDLAEIIGQHVTLKSAGVGSLRGLCPFHDERTPSFYVRPQLGFYHCFGCGESGNVYTFLTRYEQLGFIEAVERLADRIGFQLQYEDGGAASDSNNRARMLAANRAAAEFFRARLAEPDAAVARQFLLDRGFDAAAATRFGLGYAPKSWSALTDHLRGAGFTQTELTGAGLVSVGMRTAYDRFRGRLIWPIADLTGQPIGFGARALYPDDEGPKYLNTPETPLYRKSAVLYGLDLAKRQIAREQRVVVVEGYTDVMACHLAGVTTAIATCGTAFGVEHIRILRRVLGDDSGKGEVIFTFDGDEAGQKAALRAFVDEGQFRAQTFVAVAPGGQDPCELRLSSGDTALRELVDAREPLFAFVLRTTVSRYDLNTVEGRTAALHESVPIVASIRDDTLRTGYSREISRMLGLELADVERALQAARFAPRPITRGARTGAAMISGNAGNASSTRSGFESNRSRSRAHPPSSSPRGNAPPLAPPDAAAVPEAAADSVPEPPGPVPTLATMPTDPRTRAERDALQVLLQLTELLDPGLVRLALDVTIASAPLAAIRHALIRALASVDGVLHRLQPDLLLRETPPPLHQLLGELLVLPLPEHNRERLARYADGVLRSIIERDLGAQQRELLARLRRASNVDEARRIQRALTILESDRRTYRDDS